MDGHTVKQPDGSYLRASDGDEVVVRWTRLDATAWRFRVEKPEEIAGKGGVVRGSGSLPEWLVDAERLYLHRALARARDFACHTFPGAVAVGALVGGAVAGPAGFVVGCGAALPVRRMLTSRDLRLGMS